MTAAAHPPHSDGPAQPSAARGAAGFLARPASASVLLVVPVAVAAWAWLAPAWSVSPAAGLGWDLPWRGPWYRLWGWALAALAGLGYAWAWQRGLRQAAGMALMWVPLMRTLLGIMYAWADLATGGQVLDAISRHRLSSMYIGKLVEDLGYLGAGFMLWSGWQARERLGGLARRLRQTGAAVLGPGEGRSAWLGFLLFPVLLVLTVGADWLLGQAPQLVNSDESRIWDNMTIWHAVMISAAAAVGEEAVYRVLLMGLLGTGLQRLRLPAGVAWGAAVVVQAVVFGFAHAGYANWLHVIMAGLFGLVAGAAVLWLGVWAAIMLHFLVDLYAFGTHVEAPVWIGFLLALLVTNGVATLAVGGRWAMARLGLLDRPDRPGRRAP